MHDTVPAGMAHGGQLLVRPGRTLRVHDVRGEEWHGCEVVDEMRAF